MQVHIALLQLIGSLSIQDNLKKGIEFCHEAKKLGADLILFPEMWHIGYNSGLMQSQFAIDQNNIFIEQFRKKAKELTLAIAITYLGKGISKPTNNIAIINNNGNIVLNYAKVHICSFADGTERYLESGNRFKVVELIIRNKSIRVGTMICFDREFPESARSLSLQKAEIILTPNACMLKNDYLLDDVRIAQFRTRAFENMVGVAMANYASPQCDGHSCAFDVDGKQIVLADNKEGIFMATFNLEKIRAWQKKEVWGSKYLQRDAYTT